VYYTLFIGTSVFDPGQCALRDPRKFSWTKNLRQVKKVFISVKLTAHMKKHENPEIARFDPYTPYFGTICDISHYFGVNSVFDPAHMKKHENPKSLNLGHISTILAKICDIFTLFGGNSVFDPAHMKKHENPKIAQFRP